MSARTIWPGIAIVIAFVVGGILTFAFGNDPITAYRALLSGSFGDVYSIASTLVVTLPLAITGIAVAFSFRSGLFNIGAGGQYWLGGIAAAWVGYAVKLPAVLHIPLAMLAAVAAGALWGAVIPGLAKAYRGAHEVITTLMMTYIATDFGHYLLEGGPMQAPGYTPQSPPMQPSAIIATLVPGTQLTWAILLVPVIAVLAWFVLQRTSLGFSLRLAGYNLRAARYAGVNPVAAVLTALAISGGLAGLAGSIQVLGVDRRLFDGFDPSYGYTAIVVALLARNDPFGVLLAAILFGALDTGASQMQIVANVPFNLAGVIQGIIIFFIAAEGLLRYFRRRRSAPAAEPHAAAAE